MTVKDNDKEMRRMIRRLKTTYEYKVGIQGAEASKAHQGAEDTMADIASKHEFGYGVPQRSFIRETADAKINEIKEILVATQKRMLDLRRSLFKIGDWGGTQLQAVFQERISNEDPPFKPLSKRTIEQKNSSKPLVNSGQLKSSITYTFELKDA